MADFEIADTDLTNVDTVGLCGASPLGHARKREWLRQCLPEGLRYRIAVEAATGRAVGMIEYAPGEVAWRAVDAPGYMVIHCLQVPKASAGRGVGSLLVQECVEDARRNGMAGVVALATAKGWCADNRIYLKNGFQVVDRAAPSLELVATQLRPVEPASFGDWEERLRRLGPGVYMYVSKQCPFLSADRPLARREWIRREYGLSAQVIDVASHEMAQANPCVWGSSGVICNGQIVNYVSGGDAPLRDRLRRMRPAR